MASSPPAEAPMPTMGKPGCDASSATITFFFEVDFFRETGLAGPDDLRAFDFLVAVFFLTTVTYPVESRNLEATADRPRTSNRVRFFSIPCDSFKLLSMTQTLNHLK